MEIHGKILIADDDPEIRNVLRMLLEEEGYQVISAENGEEVLKKADDTIDLFILDVNMPVMSGFAAGAELRKRTYAPMIFLTAYSGESDKAIGYSAGADDYITKPFSLAVLRARVNTQLRRKIKDNRGEENTSVWTSGRYRFCFDRMEYYVDGKPVELGKNEQKLLRILVENEGITLSRGTLIDKIWTNEAEYVDENALSVTVKRLRDKLQAADRIQTVYGVGYLWVKANGQD